MGEELTELRLLAETAGASVVGEVLQRRSPIRASTYLSKGKMDEVREAALERDATLLLIDEDLSPAQTRNLEEELKLKVVDRSGLILDIFARRARTRQARLQVELAQLEYLLPRLRAHVDAPRAPEGASARAAPARRSSRRTGACCASAIRS